MSDISLMMRKHGRFMVPLLALLLILAGVRLASDSSVVLGIYGIGGMLLSVALTIYGLYSIVSLISKCNDRLMLLSPMSRWSLLINNLLVVSGYLVIGYVIMCIPSFGEGKIEAPLFFTELLSYLVSIFSGFGIMACFAYLFKKVGKSSHAPLMVSAFFIVVQCMLPYLLIKFLNSYLGEIVWVIGVGSDELLFNVFAGILPVTVIGLKIALSDMILFISINFAIGLVMWLIAWSISKTKVNYLSVG